MLEADSAKEKLRFELVSENHKIRFLAANEFEAQIAFEKIKAGE